MSARIDQGVWVPTSYRLRLSTCDPATFSRIVGDAETWPGVYEATPMQSLLDRCNQPAQPAHAGRT